jgi:DNA-binding beta-propeller fold protein YncE
MLMHSMPLLRLPRPFCAVLLSLASWLSAQDAAPAPAPLRRLIVLNKAEATASLFDPATRKEIALIRVGEGPHECATSPDGRTAVVANYGDQQPGSTLTVVDVAGARALRTIELRTVELRATDPAAEGAEHAVTYLRPHGIHFVDAEHVLVTSEAARRLLLVNVATGKVERTWTSPQTLLHMVALANDRKRAFGTSLREGSLATFALDAETPASTLLTGKGAEGIAVAPKSGEVWVTNREDDSLSICAADGSKVLAQVATRDFPIRIAFVPDGTHALVTCAEAGVIEVWSTAERTLLHSIDLLADKTERSPLPIGICVEPEGQFAWIACNRGEWLAVLDLRTWRVVDRVPTRKGPDGMAFARIAAPAAPSNR